MLNLIRLPQAHLSLLSRSPEWQPFLPPSIHTFQLGGTCKLAEDALNSVIDVTDKERCSQDRALGIPLLTGRPQDKTWQLLEQQRSAPQPLSSSTAQPAAASIPSLKHCSAFGRRSPTQTQQL